MTDDALVADVRPFVAAIPLAEFARITASSVGHRPFTLTPACRCPKIREADVRLPTGASLRSPDEPGSKISATQAGVLLGPPLEVVGANAVATGWCRALRASILTTMCLSGSYVR